MHASSSGGFRREHYQSCSNFYGAKRGVHQRFGSSQTQYQSVEHYLQLMENPTTYAIHIEIVAANQLIIVQHPRATDIDWLVNPIHYHQVQAHTTYYIATSTVPRTVHNIP